MGIRKFIDTLLLCAIFAVGIYAIYAHQTDIGRIADLLQLRSPCADPVTYSITSIDPRFQIATSTLLADVKAAEAIWEDPTHKQLFQYMPTGGEVAVSLVYDARQAATDRLERFGISIDQNKSTYNTLQSRYDAQKQIVDQERLQYDSLVSSFQTDQSAYNADVERWNNAGGAPPTEYARLNQEKIALASQFASITSLENTLNGNVDTLNALATTINQLIVQLALNVKQYNNAGAAGGEFEEGLYSQQGNARTIAIFEFTGRTQLIRVLAHEMGHALGLGHVPDPNAIMYKVNAGKGLYATSADIAELDSVCRFK